MPNLTRGVAQTSFDTGATYGNITPAIDTGNFNMLVSDCIIANKGNMFNKSVSGLVVSLASGSQAKIGGAFFVLKQNANITLQANTEQYLCLTIDKTQQSGNTGDLTIKSLLQIQKGDLYGNGSIRDLPIYKFTTNASQVASSVDLRVIVGNTYQLSESEYEALPTPLQKENYAIYEIYED